MIHIKNKKMGNIPLLIGFSDTVATAAEKGTILIYHGLHSCKEDCLEIITSLAEAGFCAIGVDNPGHGERTSILKSQFFDISNPDFHTNFFNAILTTAGEFPDLYNTLTEQGYIRQAEVGLCGVSMGGIITYEILINDDRIKAAVPLIASPALRIDHPDSPHKHPELFYPAALLQITAGLDTTVPPQAAEQMHKDLVPFYNGTPERSGYINHPHSEHIMREEDWKSSWKAAVAWFIEFM